MKKQIKYLFLLFGIIPLFAFQCEEPYYEEDYSVAYIEAGVEINPSSETINVGDTLWIQSRIPVQAQDTATGGTVNLIDAAIHLPLVVNAWNAENQNYQPDNYTIVQSESTIRVIYNFPETSVIGLDYLRSDENYVFRFGLVFHRTGTYSIDFEKVSHTQLMNGYEDSYAGYGSLSYMIGDIYHYGELVISFKNSELHQHLYDNLNEADKNSQSRDVQSTSPYYFFTVQN